MSLKPDSSDEFRPELLAEQVTRFFERHFAEQADEAQPLQNQLAAVRYSLLSGGKRFRPALAMLTAQALGFSHERVLPFAASVECIHTYSLIHDDLPCMDNDDYRRGYPTNHKVFGEATALLAGDALLTEAFAILARHYEMEPNVAMKVVGEVARAAGLAGMIGGQTLDMNSKKAAVTLPELERLHRLKTGALIRVSVVGAAHLCFATEKQRQELTRYAECVGLAFQVQDDLHDHNPQNPEPGSYPALLGVDKTRSYLESLTSEALNLLSGWSTAAEPLRQMARYNAQRKT